METLIPLADTAETITDDLPENVDAQYEPIQANVGFVKVEYPPSSVKSINQCLSQFLRVSSDLTDESIADQLIEAYPLSLPDLIISVQISDVDRHVLDEEIKRDIQRGLAETIKCTNAWITTNGLSSPANSLVAEALCNDNMGSDVPCIGFCQWQDLRGTAEFPDSECIQYCRAILSTTMTSGDQFLTTDLDSINERLKNRRSRRKSTERVRKVLKIREINRPPRPMTLSHPRSEEVSSNEEKILHLYTRQYDKNQVRHNLDHNHTYFVFFDEANIKERRQKIEEELCSKLRSKLTVGRKWNAFKSPLPIVQLLIGGDRLTLDSVCARLEAFIPLVVIRGTGLLADIIADIADKIRVHILLDEGEFKDEKNLFLTWKTDYYNEFLQSKTDLLNLYRGEVCNMTDVEDVEKRIEVLTRMNPMIVLFNPLEDNEYLENAIAEAELKMIAYKRRHNFDDLESLRKDELRWSLVWNRLEHARKFVFVSTDPMKTSNDEEQFTFMKQNGPTALYKALSHGNASFAIHLIQRGASLNDLNLHEFTLDEFYLVCARLMNVEALPLNWTSTRGTGKISNSVKFIRVIYAAYLKQYLGNYTIGKWNLTVQQLLLVQTDTELEFNFDFDKQFTKYKIESLFVWCLFMNRPDIAKILCSRCQNATVSALLAVEIYKKAAVMHVRRREEMLANAKSFDRHSKGLIDECFERDQDLAIDLLEYKAGAFFQCSPLEVAQTADCRIFLSSNTVQRFVERKWYHHFHQHHQFMGLISMPLTICLASLFFPLLPIASILFPSLFIRESIKESEKRYRYRPKTLQRFWQENAPGTIKLMNNERPRHQINGQFSSRLSRIFHRVKYFYEAPVVRFYYHTTFFFIFLIVFSYVLLVDYRPLAAYQKQYSKTLGLPIPISEFILHLYLWAMIFDEFDQYIRSSRARGYLIDIWQWLDFLGIIFYLIPFCLRFFNYESTFALSKVLLSLDLLIWCIRILYFCTAYKSLGPILVMIYKMMKHALLVFGCFLMIVLFGFSITSWSLLSTKQNLTEWDWDIMRDAFNWGIWKVFGQIAEPYKSPASGMDAVSEHDIYGTFVFFYTIIFVVISNLLLLNVLIALFNETIGHVLVKSHSLWRYQRFWLVKECREKNLLPPPLSIIYHVIRIINFVCRRTICRCFTKTNSSQSHSSTKTGQDRSIEVRRINLEKEFTDFYWRRNNFQDEEENKVIAAIKQNEIKMEEIQDDLNQVAQKSMQHNSAIEQIRDDVKYTQIVIEQAVDRIFEKLNSSRLSANMRPKQSTVKMSTETIYAQYGVLVAGGNGSGDALNQLSTPYGLCIDNDQSILIADCANHRIVEWKLDGSNIEIIAGGNGQGDRLDQLDRPTDVLIDHATDTILICDRWNRRVVRWPRRHGSCGEIIVSNVRCWGIAMDDQGFLYISNTEKHEVRRYRIGDMNGTIVAGGNGEGPHWNQLNDPGFIFFDHEQSLFVSDFYNNRVMKWKKGAKEGFLVANGTNEANHPTQLYLPSGISIDCNGMLLVLDSGNHRLMHWLEGNLHGRVIMGIDGPGTHLNQLQDPGALALDRHGNIFVVDSGNSRILRFDILMKDEVHQ